MASLVAAAPAAASTATSTFHEDPADYCGGWWQTSFVAAPGEVNRVTVGHANVILDDMIDNGPSCPPSVGADVITDPGATIRPAGDCRFVVNITNRAVMCPSRPGLIDLGDRNDTLVAPGLYAQVICGPGNDTVIGESLQAAPDCETVLLG